MTGHGTDLQHNETVVADEDVTGHGFEHQHSESVVADEDDTPAQRGSSPPRTRRGGRGSCVTVLKRPGTGIGWRSTMLVATAASTAFT